MADQTQLTLKMTRSSKAGHSMTDNAVNSRLIGLFADPKIYAGAIGCFYLIFETLEREMEKKAPSDERLSRFLRSNRSLFRSTQFEKDMLFYFGPEWKSEVEARSRFSAVDRYLDHLKQLAQTQPILLAAHAYTQHSAVASGGQIICKIVRKGLNLQSGALGAAAFEFSEPPRELKLSLKSAMDSLEAELSSEEVKNMILQHQEVFIHNNEIIKGYRIGFFSPIIASVKFATRSRAVRVALIAVLAIYAASYVRR